MGVGAVWGEAKMVGEREKMCAAGECHFFFFFLECFVLDQPMEKFHQIFISPGICVAFLH